jgi:hypothetical protein
MSKKWRGPWIGKVCDIALGSQTVRLYPIGFPLVGHEAQYLANPVSMWGFQNTWPTGQNNTPWYGTATLASASLEGGGETYRRGVMLGGQLTQMSPARHGPITALVAGITWAPVIAATGDSSNLLRVTYITISQDNHAFTPTGASWYAGFAMQKLNQFNGNKLILQSGSTKPNETDVTTSTEYQGTTTDNLIGRDILDINSRFLNVWLQMFAYANSIAATFGFSALYIDVTYTQQ